MDGLEGQMAPRGGGPRRLVGRPIVDEPDRRVQLRVVQRAVQLIQQCHGGCPVVEDWDKYEQARGGVHQSRAIIM